jgi:hypothetical protein
MASEKNIIRGAKQRLCDIYQQLKIEVFAELAAFNKKLKRHRQKGCYVSLTQEKRNMGNIINIPVIRESSYPKQSDGRYCSRCKTTRSVKEFHRNARYCKPCRKVYRHEQYLLNRDREIKAVYAYDERFPENKKMRDKKLLTDERRLWQRHAFHRRLGYKPRIKPCRLCNMPNPIPNHI